MKNAKLFLALVLALILINSCEKSEVASINTNVPVSDTTISGYLFEIENISGPGADKTLVADSVNSSWFPEAGLMYLGADDENEPLGTLTIQLEDSIFIIADGLFGSNILTAVLSTSDASFGTAGQINARSYELDPTDTLAQIAIWYMNGNVVGGNILSMKMNRLIVNSNTTPETINVHGDFVCRNQ